MKKERPLPYVGVSGVAETDRQSISVQYWLMDQFGWQGLDSDDNPHMRQIALGVKAVHKTQYLDIENKYGRAWYPVGEEEFANALRPGGGTALRVAQMYLDPEHIGDAEYRNVFVERVCRRGRAWLNSIQFDMLPWHEEEAMLRLIEKVKVETGHTMILQAHSESMSKLGPQGLFKKLGRYAYALDYILFDASHGKGVRMNVNALKPESKNLTAKSTHTCYSVSAKAKGGHSYARTTITSHRYYLCLGL